MLQRLSAIVRKELITMLRDPRARLSLIIPPIIQLFVFSSAATMEVKNIAVAVVDLDRGPYALDVQQRLGGSRSFTRLPRYANVASARGALEREQVIGILVLPSGFSADLSAGRPASAQLLLDGRRSNAAQITAQYVSTIMAAEGAPLSGAPPQARTGGAGPAPPPNAEVVIDNWFNPNLEYQWFMMPNLVGMLSLAVALMITALSVARERELGTFDQTLVSPATPIEIALGKLLPPLLVASVQATLYLLIVTLLYGVPFRGNLLVFCGDTHLRRGVRRGGAVHLLPGAYPATGFPRRVRGTAAIRTAVGIRNAGGEHALVAAVRHDDQSARAHVAPHAGAVPQGRIGGLHGTGPGETARDRAVHHRRCGTVVPQEGRVALRIR